MCMNVRHIDLFDSYLIISFASLATLWVFDNPRCPINFIVLIGIASFFQNLLKNNNTEMECNTCYKLRSEEEFERRMMDDDDGCADHDH